MALQQKELHRRAALEWIAANTSFDPAEGEALPAGIELFIQKFDEVMGQTGGVASESLGGMSQSFTAQSGALVHQYAEELLAPWYSGGKFVTARKRWV